MAHRSADSPATATTPQHPQYLLGRVTANLLLREDRHQRGDADQQQIDQPSKSTRCGDTREVRQPRRKIHNISDSASVLRTIGAASPQPMKPGSMIMNHRPATSRMNGPGAMAACLLVIANHTSG